MTNEKLYPIIRKLILSNIAYWAYILICYAGFSLIIAANTSITPQYSTETEYFVSETAIYIWQTVISYVAFIPLFYDFLVCDRRAQHEYFATLPENPKFSVKAEIKALPKNKAFVIGASVIAFWSVALPGFFTFLPGCLGVPNGSPAFLNRLIIFAVFTVPAVIMYGASVVISHRRWFSQKGNFYAEQKAKGIYAFRLIKNGIIWAVDFLLLDYLIILAKFVADPITRGLRDYLLPTLIAIVAICAFVFVYRRIRALLKQRAFLKMLKSFCAENKLKLYPPKAPYSAVLKHELRPFALETPKLRFECLLVPSAVRKIPIYFPGDSTLIRAHTFCFFKIPLFTKQKEQTYSFGTAVGEKTVIKSLILSPIPRELFVGDLGKSAPADNGSQVGDAVIYSGSAFCNYIKRLLDNDQKPIKKNRFNAEYFS